MYELHEEIKSRTMTGFVLGILVLFALIGAAVLWQGDLLGGLFYAAIFALLMSVMWIFSVIRLDVDAKSVRASFRGFLPRKIDYGEIEGVETARYRWTEFWGWGLRWNFSGDQAYSIMGVSGCVRIHLKGGSDFVVTCHDPERVREAIDKHLDAYRAALNSL